MAMTTKQKAMTAALLALISSSTGGYEFLKKHHNPTMREVYASCEKGELSGLVCCEDTNSIIDWNKPFETCGMISAGNPDPLGYRIKEEDDWDKAMKGATP